MLVKGTADGLAMVPLSQAIEVDRTRRLLQEAPLRYAIAGHAGSWADRRFNQIASLSSSNAVASRNTGAASTPNW